MTADELDRAVAERILGWRLHLIPDGSDWWWYKADGIGLPYASYDGWHPTGDMGQAWQVAKRLMAQGWHLTLYETHLATRWHAIWQRWDLKTQEVEADGPTAPWAICAAGLATQGAKR